MSTPSLSLNIDALNGINVSNSSSSGQIVLRTNTIPKSLLDSSNNNTLLSVKGDLDISGNLTNNTITNMKNDITNLQLGNVTMSDNQRNLLSNNLEATTVNLIEPSGNFNTLTSITKRWNNEILTHPVSLLGLNNNIPAIATSKNNLANNYSIITNHSSSDISNTDLSGNQIINLFSTNDTFFVKNSKEETSYIKQYSISNSGSFVFWNLQTLVDRGAELKSEIDFQNMFGENATIANELLRMKNDSVINWEDIYIVGNNNPSVKALGNAESNIAGYANGQTIDYYVNQMQNNVAITNYFTPGNVLTDVVDQNDDDINSDFIISGILESVNNIKSNKIWLYIPGLAGKEYRDHNNLLLFPIKSKVLYLCSEGEFTNNTNYKEKYGLSIIDTDKFLLSYTNNIKISNVDSSLYFNNNSGRYKINYFKKDTVSDYTQPFGLNDSSGNDIDIVKVHKFKCQVQLLLYNNGVANSKIIANELKTTDNKNTDIDITYTGSNYKDFIDLINSNIYLYKPLLIINGITVFITSATLAGQSENGQDKYALTFSRVQNDISSWIGTPNQLLLSADKSTDIYPIFSSFVTFRYKQNTNNVYTIPNNVTTIIVPNFITEWDITNVNNYSIYNVTTGSNNSVWYNSPVNNNNGEWIDYVKIPNHFIYNSQNTTWKKGNNLIYYNNNVGIGTDNPTEKLHIEGNVVITGQILTSGQTTVLDSSNITINDPITVLAANNIANILDIGIVGKYNDGVSKFAGLIRDATDNVFKLFDSTTENLLSKNVVTFGANSINMADLYVGQLGLEDINNSNILKLKWNEDDNTDRTLNIKVVNSDRILNLGGDLIVETNSKVNQDLTTDSSVTFNKITLTSGAQDGYILQSDANGVGNWNTLNSISSGSILVNCDSTNNVIDISGSIIPKTNETFDLGSSDKKFRHLFLSNNSLWIGDTHKISVSSDGNLKFRKRITNTVPQTILDAGGTESGLKTFTSKTNLSDITLDELLKYMRTLPNKQNSTVDDIFRDNNNDYSENTESGKLKTYEDNTNQDYYIPFTKTLSGDVDVATNNNFRFNPSLGKIKANDLEISTIKITSSAQNGYVLKSDANGVGTWQQETIPTYISSGDTIVGTVDTTSNEHIYFNVNNNTKMRIWGSGVVNIYNTLDTVGFKMVTNAQNGYVLKSDANGVGTWQQEYNYTLPTASSSVLGGIKVGNNLSIDNGVLSAIQGTYTLPTASSSVLGGIKVGNNLSIDGNGVLSATANGNSISSGDTTIGTVDTTNNEHIYFNVNNNTKMRIWGSGVVNIYNTLDTVGFKMVTNAQNGYVLKSDANGVGTWQPESANVWSINGSRIFYNTDNVGIGVTNPNDKLDISGGNININSSPSTTIIQPINPTGSPPYWYQGKDSNYVTNYTGSNHYVVPTTSGISTSENFYAYFKFKSTSTGHEPLLYDGDTYKFGLQLNVGTGSDGWMLPFVDSSSPYNIPFTNYRQEFINLGQTIPNFFVTNTEYEVLVHYNLTVGQVSFKMYFKQDYGNQGSLNPYHLILTYDTNNISASVNNYVSQSLNTVTFTSQGLYLGRQAGGNFFNGTIDRFAFFILGNYQLTSSQIDQIFNRGSYTSSIYSYGPTSDEVSNTTYKGLKLNSDNEGVYSDASNIYLKSGGNSIKFPRTSGSNGEILKISNVSNNITTLDWSADSTSDSRLKKDILNCCYGLEDLIKMRPITFKWNDNAIFKDNRTRVGLIAEEVEEIIPEIVGTDSRNNKYIEYNQITSVMIKAIQELKEKNDKLEKDKNDLKLEISNILSRLDNAGL